MNLRSDVFISNDDQQFICMLACICLQKELWAALRIPQPQQILLWHRGKLHLPSDHAEDYKLQHLAAGQFKEHN